MNAPEKIIPTEAEIVARAEALIPWLRERADACEKARMVSPETIQKFSKAYRPLTDGKDKK